MKFVRNSHAFLTKCVRSFVRFSYEFAPLSIALVFTSLTLSLAMSQQTISQLASLQPRPDVAADTLAQYQALLVDNHQMEEATY